jgi:polar amino acid transport system permease protein
MSVAGLEVVARRLPEFLQATLINLSVFAALIAIGFVVGLLVALAQVYGSRPLASAAVAWEWFFRGVPALVLLFLFYYGFPRFGIETSAFLAGALAMGFRSSGYQSQIFRGALQSVPAGQVMAARSLGMSRVQTVGSIVLQQALRLAIPAWSNEFSSVLKDTTLVYAIGINEVMRYARTVYVSHAQLAIATFLTVAFIFWAFTSMGNALLGRLEKRLAVPGLESRDGASRRVAK